MAARINVASPDLSGNEERYLLDALRSSWISSTGPYVDRFEREFAAFCGATAATGVANGTVALHLALLALGATKGDEIIVPSLSYVATANAVCYVGASPVFADVSPATWCIDPEQIRDAVTARTRGIIAVHLYGHPADMDAINQIAAEHGLWVIEDAAEAHGARYRTRTVGALSAIGTFSFYGNKILTSGEGGAVVTNDPALDRRMRLLRGQGMDPEHRYFFPIIGYNYRLTNLACAILCAQLERFEAIIAQRRQVFDWYRRSLEGIPGIGFQPVAEWADPVPWLFCITVDESIFGQSRDQLAAHLDRRGIETRPFFIPIHSLPPYALAGDGQGRLPVTTQLASTGMNLPTSTSVTQDQVRLIADEIRNSTADQ